MRVAIRAAEEWGVLSLDELRECGLSHDEILGRADRGHLHRRYRTVYAVGHTNLPLEGQLLAAVKACGPGAVLSHFSAAALWDMVSWDGRFPEVTVAGTSTRVHPGIRVHRAGRLDADDVVKHKGIRVTSPARTVADVASILAYRPLRRAVREALARERVNLSQLVEVLNRLGPRPGVRNLARILARGPVPTRSELEDIVLAALLGGGLAKPDVNIPLRLAGRRVIPDFRWPAQRLVVEADGATWHDNPIARADDAERQALLEAHGERVLRVTWTQAISHSEQTLSRIRAAGAPLADQGEESD
jgi:uncharacterized protein DUF559